MPYNFSSSSSEKKPRWWWRTLACLPYLMPLHTLSVCAEGAHPFIPFLEHFALLADPIFGAELPHWFLIVYCLGIYYLVVRRKTVPHFFRFHVIMAMLLENAVQITAIVFRMMPYWCSLDASFWIVASCAMLFALSVCIRDSLRGMLPNIPAFSEAAFMHTTIH